VAENGRESSWSPNFHLSSSFVARRSRTKAEILLRERSGKCLSLKKASPESPPTVAGPKTWASSYKAWPLIVSRISVTCFGYSPLKYSKVSGLAV